MAEEGGAAKEILMEDGKWKIDNRKSKIVGQCAECQKDATGLYVTGSGLLCLDCAVAHKGIVKEYPNVSVIEGGDRHQSRTSGRRFK